MNYKSKKLDVGCAFRKPRGYFGIDKVKVPGVDKIVDLTKFPWPLKDNSFDEVRLWHILQFLPETVKTMEEVWRVSKPHAKIIIAVPYYMSALAFGDPSHIRYFSEETFKYFTNDSWYISHHSAYTKAKLKIIRQEMRTSGKFRKYLPFKRFLHYFAWNLIDELVLEMEVEKNKGSILPVTFKRSVRSH
jgi:predicted SAM-dependent methyltransferase